MNKHKSNNKHEEGKRREKQVDMEVEEGKRRGEKNVGELLSENESLDEEDELTRVKIGKVPYGWYEEFKHFGYDNKLKPVLKPKATNKIQQFIQKSENKDWWRTIRDELNCTDIRLTDEQLNMIDRIRSGKMASKTIATSNYQFETDREDPFPVNAYPPSKKNFKPSKWQQMKVNKILDGLLTGRIKWNADDDQEKKEDIYDAWASGSVPERGVISIAPMKEKPPTHAESYNPSKQFLFTPEEKEEWEEMDEEDRPLNYVPTNYDKMRKIPFYDKLIQERFQRCLDLYLCPRVKKKKLNIDPDTFVPKLPDPKTLKPFPTSVAIIYEGHSSPVQALAVSPSGDYLATGDETGLFAVWEVLSSRMLFSKQFDSSVNSIDWSFGNVIGIGCGQRVELMLWKYNKEMRKKGEGLLEEGEKKTTKGSWMWYENTTEQYREGFRVRLQLGSEVSHIEFEKSRGDYFVTVCPEEAKKNEVISIHRISTSGTEKNFLKGGGIIKKVLFYPGKAQILILTSTKVVLFSLEKLEKLKQLSSSGNIYSCICVHPLGGYVLVGTQSKKLLCYDLNLSTKPYKVMEYHDKGLTSSEFHGNYPLMGTASHDGTIHMFHFKVENDMFSDAVVLPLKVLKGHQVKGVHGINNIKFHPKQPWVFSTGSDHKVFMWT